jgi:hypothetical protein
MNSTSRPKFTFLARILVAKTRARLVTSSPFPISQNARDVQPRRPSVCSLCCLVVRLGHVEPLALFHGCSSRTFD